MSVLAVDGSTASQNSRALDSSALHGRAWAAGIALLVGLGSAALLPVWRVAWVLWSNDPLRSIGMFFPAISLVGVCAVWRKLGWRTGGTWWGLAPILLAMAGARLFSAFTLQTFYSGQAIRLLHPGIAMFAYGVGAVLLFGGVPLLRRALAPLCLLLMIDPVPHIFNTLLDMPLQLLSANTARGFAHMIGLQPTGEQLKMMFTPDFGMLIVPGCNGIRGAVTFGYLAVIFGYARGLPARALAGFGCAAVLLGYFFNLVRLCVLVLYYRVGLSVPSIRDYGTEVDYAIGTSVFLVATLGLGVAIRLYQLRCERMSAEPVSRQVSTMREAGPGARELGLRAGVLALLAVGFFVSQAHASPANVWTRPNETQAIAALPQDAGPYHLTQSWAERDHDGSPMLVFGDYTNGVTGEHLTMGVWLIFADHLVAASRMVKGVLPESNGSFDGQTSSGNPAHFVSNFYRDGGTRTLDAETVCAATFCDERTMGGAHGLFVTVPHLADLFVAPATRRVSILLRREVSDASISPDASRRDFERAAQQFMRGLNLQPLITLGAS